MLSVKVPRLMDNGIRLLGCRMKLQNGEIWSEKKFVR